MGWGTEWEKQLEGGSGIEVKRKWGEADEESKDAGDGCRERGCTCQRGWSSGEETDAGGGSVLGRRRGS